MRPDFPLYLYALEEEEVTELRAVLVTAKKTGLFEQQRFMGGGGDIRNFLEKPSSRPGPALLARLYNFVMQELDAKVDPFRQADAEVRKLHSKMRAGIDELIRLGLESGRYARDTNQSMRDVLGDDIAHYNVPPGELGIYIGYRYRTDMDEVIRFAVNVWIDPRTQRTKFSSYARLGHNTFGDRETQGFAYFAKSNLYLSGFLNDREGYELIALGGSRFQSVRTGIVTTTSPEGSPNAKLCALVNARKTIFSKYIPGDPAARPRYHDIGRFMIPMELSPHEFRQLNAKGDYSPKRTLYNLLKREFEGASEAADFITRFLDRDKMLRPFNAGKGLEGDSFQQEDEEEASAHTAIPHVSPAIAEAADPAAKSRS